MAPVAPGRGGVGPILFGRAEGFFDVIVNPSIARQMVARQTDVPNASRSSAKPIGLLGEQGRQPRQTRAERFAFGHARPF